jgi:hypothetical protein
MKPAFSPILKFILDFSFDSFRSVAHSVSVMKTRFTKHGPNGLRVEFDANEIFPNDPGQGTPVLVCLGRETASFCCALNEGEVGGSVRLSPAQLAFLESLEEFVWDFTSPVNA